MTTPRVTAPIVDVDLLTEALVAIALDRVLFKVRPFDETLRAAIDTLVFRSPPPLRASSRTTDAGLWVAFVHVALSTDMRTERDTNEGSKGRR